MANVVVTLRIMPESPEVDLKKLEQDAGVLIKAFGCEIGKVDILPVAFGLNALNLIFVMDEQRGSTDELEVKLRAMPHVHSVECVDVRRAIG